MITTVSRLSPLVQLAPSLAAGVQQLVLDSGERPLTLPISH
jgi:hypothetical protein